MRPFPALALALALPVLLAGSPASADSVSVCAIAQADFRFHDPESTRTRFGMAGDLNATRALAAVDPLSAPLRLTVGSFTLVDLPASGGARRVREVKHGWRVDLPDAFGEQGRFSLRMNPANGNFSASARGFTPGVLLAYSPAGVPVTLTVGEETWATTVDFDTGRPGRWTHRLVVAPTPPPPGGGGGGGGGDGSVVTIASGQQSGITTQRFETVKDQSAWDALWLEHAGSLPAPAVDFGTKMVVGVWLGAKPTTGYSVNIQRMVVPYTVYVGGWCPPCTGQPCPGVPCFGGTPTEGGMADCLEIDPGPGCVSGQAVTYPYHIVVTSRIEGPVVFQLLTATYCNY